MLVNLIIQQKEEENQSSMVKFEIETEIKIKIDLFEIIHNPNM